LDKLEGILGKIDAILDAFSGAPWWAMMAFLGVVMLWTLALSFIWRIEKITNALINCRKYTDERQKQLAALAYANREREALDSKAATPQLEAHSPTATTRE